MKRDTRNASKSKQDIIEKSAPIFNMYGYAGAKMQMIVDETGYQKGGIYCHFNSKLELAKEAFSYNYKKLNSIYFQGVLDLDSPKEQMLRFKKNYQQFLRKPTIQGGCPILNTAIDVDDTQPEFRELVNTALQNFTLLLQSILKNGQLAGEFKSDFNPKEEVNYIIATMEGAIMLGQLKQNRRLVLRISEKLFQYIEENLFVTGNAVSSQ